MLLVLGGLLAAGCATGRREAQNSRMARHPFEDTRMSSQPAEGYSPSGVFRIRGARNTMYLAGTCHVVTDDQIPFPSAFYGAYQNAREIYAEMDVTRPPAVTNLRMTFRLFRWVKAHAKELVCPKGMVLSNYVSAATLAELRTSYGKDYSRMRITPLMLLLLNEGGVFDVDALERGRGVDDTFLLQAHKDRKPIHQLDDGSITDTVILLLDEMLAKWRRDIAKDGVDAVIEENMLNKTEDDNRSWRSGDMSAVEEDHEEMKREAPAIYEKGVVERNHKWMTKLKHALDQKKDVMVLVGVDHLGGKDGLLHLLTEAGFAVEQMYGVDSASPVPSREPNLSPKSHRAEPLGSEFNR
jgi:uncharacterized protein YbaP (TraB family)